MTDLPSTGTVRKRSRSNRARKNTKAEVQFGLPSPQPLKVGRPSLYDRRYCELLLRLVDEEGLSERAVAGYIGVAHNTLGEWAQRHPEFLTALNVASARRRLFFEREARRVTWAGKDANAYTFAWWSKNADGWRDQLDVNVTLGPTPAELAFREVR